MSVSGFILSLEFEMARADFSMNFLPKAIERFRFLRNNFCFLRFFKEKLCLRQVRLSGLWSPYVR